VRFILTEPAKRDLADATDYYESVSPGGGVRFLQRYEKAVSRILQSPRGLPKYYWRTRLCPIGRSYYGIVYRPVRKDIYVLGIICVIREPGYWKSRVTDFTREA
jgi:plasmid stabilization system protein ParE